MTKNNSNRSKWLSSVPIGLALVLSIVFGYIETYRAMHNSDYFSAESLQSLRSLNFQYEVMVDDLSEPLESQLMTDLFKANALVSTGELEKESRGLVVSLDGDISQKGYLLLQPTDELSDLELETIAHVYQEAIPEFLSVEIDQDVELLGMPLFNINWGKTDVELSGEDVELEKGYLEPIVVAVVDSGVDVDHEIFDGHEMLTGWNTIDGDTSMYDDVGHGTHIAGIVASEMLGAAIAPYKIVDSRGGRLSNVIEALEKAIDDDVDVINTSFGLFSPSASLEKLVEEAYDERIIIVSAAGNDDSSSGFYPATYDHTIAVASLYPNGKKMDKSNYGDWVDIAALGYRVRSSIPDDSYGYKSGTSQSTAFISAEVARILASYGLGKSLDFEDVLEKLTRGLEEIEIGELAGVVALDD